MISLKAICGLSAKTSSPGRSILVVMVLLSSFAPSAADEFRAPMPLAEIIGTSDAIVIGRLTSVSEEMFGLHVSEVISAKQPLVNHDLVVRRSPRLPTDPRWAPYKEGQIILAFLKEDGGGRQPCWSFTGVPNDSEWPVDEERVYLYDRFIDGLPLLSITIHDHDVHTQTLSRNVVTSALDDYGSCFVWEPDPANEGRYPTRICNNDMLEKYCAESVIHRHIALEALRLMDALTSSQCNVTND